MVVTFLRGLCICLSNVSVFFSCEHFLEGFAFTWWGLQTRVVHKVKKTSGLRNLWPEHVQFHWTWTCHRLHWTHHFFLASCRARQTARGLDRRHRLVVLWSVCFFREPHWGWKWGLWFSILPILPILVAKMVMSDEAMKLGVRYFQIDPHVSWKF